jgi:hemolysin activation/secretion protein
VQDTIGPTRVPEKAPPAQLVFPKPPPPVKHDPNERRFTVNAFQFVGNSVYSSQSLKRLIERYVDLQLNLYDLSRAADSITRFYQENGYPVARAVVPAQKVDQGIVRIEVIEGRVGAVRFEGNRRYSASYLDGRLNSLRPGAIITTDGLEQDLLLLNDLPGLTARAVLEPGKEFGTTDIIVQVQEKFFSTVLRPNNNGRKEIGLWRMDAGTSFNNVLGFGDQMGFYGIYSQDGLLKYDRASYSIPVSSRGTRLEAAVSSSNYRVRGDITQLGVTGDALNRELTLTHPFIRTRSQSLVFHAGGRSTHLRQQTFGIETSNTSIDIYTAGLTYNQIGEDASLANLNAQVSSNFKGNPLGLRTDAERFKFDIDGSQLRGVTREWDGYGHVAFSYSPEPLADSEKFSLGGPGSVRGYRPSEVRGDGGILVTAEGRHPFTAANRLGILSFFYDYGLARFKATPGFVDGTQTLQSVGAGVTYYLHPSVTFKLEVATPVGNTIRTDGKHERVWISLTGYF